MATVTNDGLDDLMTWLDRLPTSLTEKAAPIVEAAARTTQSAAESGYPEKSGDLKRGLKVEERSSGSDAVRYVVTNTSPHALWFENGTQTRRTRQGWPRGAMPPGHVLIPAAMRARAEMYRALKRMLEAEGFQVTGDV